MGPGPTLKARDPHLNKKVKSISHEQPRYMFCFVLVCFVFHFLGLGNLLVAPLPHSERELVVDVRQCAATIVDNTLPRAAALHCVEGLGAALIGLSNIYLYIHVHTHIHIHIHIQMAVSI